MVIQLTQKSIVDTAYEPSATPVRTPMRSHIIFLINYDNGNNISSNASVFVLTMLGLCVRHLLIIKYYIENEN